MYLISYWLSSQFQIEIQRSAVWFDVCRFNFWWLAAMSDGWWEFWWWGQADAVPVPLLLIYLFMRILIKAMQVLFLWIRFYLFSDRLLLLSRLSDMHILLWLSWYGRFKVTLRCHSIYTLVCMTSWYFSQFGCLSSDHFIFRVNWELLISYLVLRASKLALPTIFQ